jgi:hypothetical protein
MADVQRVPLDRLPVPVTAPGHLFGQVHSYGVAHELERMRQGSVPPPRAPRIRTRSPVPAVGRLRRWWAGSDRRPVDLWHRIRCRTGHHELRGGHQMQLGNRFVFVERRCRWCDAAPPI